MLPAGVRQSQVAAAAEDRSVLDAGIFEIAGSEAEIISALTEEQEKLCGSADAWTMFQENLLQIQTARTRWFAGDYGLRPIVRDQGKYGTCWALTAASALETSMLAQQSGALAFDTLLIQQEAQTETAALETSEISQTEPAAQHLVFSADHLSLANAFTADVNAGGDYLMTMAYLCGWQGPVLESEDPYGDAYSPEGLQPAVHVQEVQVLESPSREELKKALVTYGAVQTSLFMNRGTTDPSAPYYSEAFSAYRYTGAEAADHDVLILGWDDAFSRFSFRNVPEEDGAWICQNTWGSDFGEDGIFYVSYEDARIAQTGIVYSRIDPADYYSGIYQTDDCGWKGSQGYDEDSCWMANVYTAEDDELLAAIGLYATAPDAHCEVYMVTDFQGTDSFAEKQYLQSADFENTGYYTIDLEAMVQLSAGERFAVVVQITTPGSDNPVAVEYRADVYTQNVTTAGKEGYISQTGESWLNTETSFRTNVCLKAYTKAM
jgi:C1A family cysteine protease